ncbi:MAG TPA: hypothetical protein VKB86_19560 [Pyrinomonadaceae bacterium]|nr:hypothetical protein [Pyrinomonadaceae bacterium]
MYIVENSETNRKMRIGFIGRAALLSMLAAMLLTALSFNAGAQTAAPSQLTITISSQGMTPSAATISTGIVHLKVQNQSSQDTLTLRVNRQGGELLREISVTEKGERAIELELSAAGQYVISEASNSSWTCTITAQAPPSSGSAPGATPHP